MPNGIAIVLGLVGGLLLGILISHYDLAALAALAETIAPLGVLWLNALRMTVIPLVFALLVTGVASAAGTATTGRLAAITLALFVGGLVFSALLGVAMVQGVLSTWPLDATTREALQAGARASLPGGASPADYSAGLPGGDWLTAIVPVNPIGSAAAGLVLPLVVFALFFGFAASRLPPESRDRLVGFFHAIGEAMLVIVRWVLWAAPVGVFVLALGVGMRGGLGAAGAILYYVVLACGIGLVLTLACYPVAVWAGRVPLARFARGVAPAQVVAFSTQSSLASLPAMIAGAREIIGLPERTTSIVLPLAVTLFRLSSPAMNLVVVLFVAHVLGMAVTSPMLLAGALVAIVNSLSSAGLPGQSSFFTGTVPVAFAMGVPIELLALLLAVEVVPDIFRTLANVTGDVTVAVVAERASGSSG